MPLRHRLRPSLRARAGEVLAPAANALVSAAPDLARHDRGPPGPRHRKAALENSLRSSRSLRSLRPAAASTGGVSTSGFPAVSLPAMGASRPKRSTSMRNSPERVAQLLVDEGDIVSPGQIVARMDTRDVKPRSKGPRRRCWRRRKHSTRPRPMSRSRQTQSKLRAAGVRSHECARRARFCDLRTSRPAPAGAQWRDRGAERRQTIASGKPSARSMPPSTRSSSIR